jgi:protein TonB
MLQIVLLTFRDDRATQAVGRMPPSARTAALSRRRPARWPRRAGAALVVSAVAHAAAAVTVGGLLAARSPGHADDVLDVDVAPTVAAPEESPPASPEPAPAPATLTPVRTRAAAHRRAVAVSAAPAASVPADVVPPPHEQGPPARFVLSAGTVATTAAAAAPGPPTAGVGPGAAAAPAGDVVGEGDVSVPARLLAASPLVYPPAARQAEIEVDLPMEIVVGTDGRVSSARALSRAGYGLDESALRALRDYRFSPALRAGRPVRVRMRWTVQFRLR